MQLSKIINGYNVNEIINSLERKYTISNNTHCARGYILPDGKILELDIFNSHASVNNYLIDQGFKKPDDEKTFIPELISFIRFNFLSEGFVALTNIKPTLEQYDILDKLFQYFIDEKNMHINYDDFMIIEPHPSFKFHRYKLYGEDAYFSDDYIKIIKRYYTTGVLVEKLD